MPPEALQYLVAPQMGHPLRAPHTTVDRAFGGPYRDSIETIHSAYPPNHRVAIARRSQMIAASIFGWAGTVTGVLLGLPQLTGSG